MADYKIEPGGGQEVSEIRYCPACGRIGNVTLCGPHAYKGMPPISETVRHPDEALQAAFRMGGLQAAAEYAKELQILTPRNVLGHLPAPVARAYSDLVRVCGKDKK